MTALPPTRSSKAKRKENREWNETLAMLSDAEANTLASFRAWIDSPDAPSSPFVPKNKHCAMMFVRGSKFRLDRAKEKFVKWCAFRDSLGDCSLDRIAPFIATDVHCMPSSSRDANGCAMMFVVPAKLDKHRDQTTRNRVRSTAYLFDRALTDPSIQRNGISIVVDFHNAPFSINRKAQADTHRLVDAMPCRFGAGYVIEAPWFFGTLLTIVAAFTAKKLLARIQCVSRQDLIDAVGPEHIPVQLGGTLAYDAYTFLLDEYATAGKTPPSWMVDRQPPPPPVEESW